MKRKTIVAVAMMLAATAGVVRAEQNDDFAVKVVQDITTACPAWNSADWRDRAASTVDGKGDYGTFATAYAKLSEQMTYDDGRKMLILLASPAWGQPGEREQYAKAVAGVSALVAGGVLKAPITADMIVNFEQGMATAGMKMRAEPYNRFVDALIVGDVETALAAVRAIPSGMVQYFDYVCKGWGGEK